MGITLGTIPLVDLSRPDVKEGKHIAQHSSLISRIKGLLPIEENAPCCFVELGSGVGRLSDQLQEETNARHWHVMIDREEFKSTRLRDRIMQKRAGLASINKKETSGSDADIIRRITDDIKNVHFDRAISGMPSTVRAVAVSKHLCGKGFDMYVFRYILLLLVFYILSFLLNSFFSALRKLVDYAGSSSLDHCIKESVPLCMAPCCHSQCEWESCFYQPFFTALGFTPRDYTIIASVSQWASIISCKNDKLNDDGVSSSLIHPITELEDSKLPHGLVIENSILDTLENASSISVLDSDHQNFIIGTNLNEENILLSLSSDEFEARLRRDYKRQLGVKCKEIIDIGRAVGLVHGGYKEVELIRYTSSSIENLLFCGK